MNELLPTTKQITYAEIIKGMEQQEYAIAMLFCVDVMRDKTFKDVSQALQIYKAVNDALFYSKDVVATIGEILVSFEQLGISEQQQHFILVKSLEYFEKFNFKKKYQQHVKLVIVMLKRYLYPVEKEADAKLLRRTIRNAIAVELEKLPSLLATMDNEKKMNLIAKLMPYTQPAVKNTGINWETF